MQINYYLNAEVVDGKAMALSTKMLGDKIMVLGSTMPTSVRPDTEQHSSIVLYPEKGKEGIVAIVIRISRNMGKAIVTNEEAAFLEVSWKEKEGELFPWIDLNHQWFPADRIGQLVSYAVEVVIKGRRFSSSSSPHSKLARVPDGDLLCRYLFGLASPEEVVHAAVQEKVELKAREQIPAIREALDRMQSLADELKRAAKSKDKLFADLLEVNKGLSAVVRHFNSLPWYARLFPYFRSEFVVAEKG